MTTLLNADVQIVIKISEDILKQTVYGLSPNAAYYNLNESTNKAKTINGFHRFKVTYIKYINKRKDLREMSHLSHLGCDFSFKFDKGIEKKVNRFQTI